MATNANSTPIKTGRVGVLLIHGLAGTPHEMRFVANGLTKMGYTVSCPKLPGHCGSEADLAAATWQQWYAACDKALDELRQTCDHVVAGGLSTGALLALLLAANRPNDVQSLALYAPTLEVNGWSIPWTAKLFKLVHHKWFANLMRFKDKAPHGIKDARIRAFFLHALNGPDSSQAGLACTPGGAMLEHRWLVNELRPKLGKITQPTLILHPRADDLADVSNAWELQRKMQGRVDISVLEDSYHNVTLDAQRHLVVERTGEFVASVQRELAAAAAKEAMRARNLATAKKELAAAA